MCRVHRLAPQNRTEQEPLFIKVVQQYGTNDIRCEIRADP